PGDNRLPLSCWRLSVRHFLFAGLWLACAPLAAAANCLEGAVFADANGNGLRDAGEQPLAGIAVSDGEYIVRTGADGRYQLPASTGAPVFVIKPAGYRVATRADGLPDIWRAGTQPGTRKGSRKSSAGAQCHPFALVLDGDAPASFQTLLMADSQTSNAQVVGYFERDIIAPLRGNHQARLGLTLGDITNDEPALYPALVAAVTSLGVP